MEVIDLLNKIANREEVPKKIKVYGEVFRYVDMWQQYVSESDERPLLYRMSAFNYSGLNDEVEIIEEDKFEYIDQIHNDDDIPQRYNSKIKNTNLIFTDLDRITRYKVNELIDEVNELRKIIYNFKNVEELDIDLYTTEGGIRTAKKINEIIDKLNKGE